MPMPHHSLGVTKDYLMDDLRSPPTRCAKEAFYRKFSKLTPEDQEKVTDIIERWGAKKT